MRIWQKIKNKLAAGKVYDLTESGPDPLTELDLSFWNTNDREWVARRRDSWSVLEDMVLSVVEVKKFLPRIKAYFLRGEIPDWDKGQAKYDPKPHLNLFLFLWLHPSRDEAILNELRETYINSPTIWHRDVELGYFKFLQTQTYWTTFDYANIEGYETCPNLEGYGELFFRVLYINPAVRETIHKSAQVELANGSPGNILSRSFTIPEQKFNTMTWMYQWLRLDQLMPINEEFLYQYDDVLNYWYQNVKDTNYFDLKSNRKMKPSWYKILYTFHHFDTEREGATCRTRFVTKLRNLFDEEKFFDEFNQMWGDIKNDSVKVEDLWEP